MIHTYQISIKVLLSILNNSEISVTQNSLYKLNKHDVNIYCAREAFIVEEAK